MVDVTQVLIGLDGEAYRTAPQTVMLENGVTVENPDSKPLTLRQGLQGALGFRTDKLPYAKQAARYKLAKRIQKEDTVEFTTKQVQVLKDVCAEKYPPLLTGLIGELLEPNAEHTDADL